MTVAHEISETISQNGHGASIAPEPSRAAKLRYDANVSDSAIMGRRRGVVVSSLIGIASMAFVSLKQTGMIKHLPDPPVPGFDSDKVNLSDTAFSFGAPDGTIALAGFALNVPLAMLAGEHRADEMPWLPLAITAKAAADAVVSSWYFYQMPVKEKAWCGYCIAATVASIATLALTLPEARTALRRVRSS